MFGTIFNVHAKTIKVVGNMEAHIYLTIVNLKTLHAPNTSLLQRSIKPTLTTLGLWYQVESAQLRLMQPKAWQELCLTIMSRIVN